MNREIIEQTGNYAMGWASGTLLITSVLKKALKMLKVVGKIMKYGTKKTNQGSRKPFGLETGVTAGKHLARTLMFQGASGMEHESPNASSRLDVTPLLMMSLSNFDGI